MELYLHSLICLYSMVLKQHRDRQLYFYLTFTIATGLGFYSLRGCTHTHTGRAICLSVLRLSLSNKTV
jgi:hypothetical protein